MEDAIKAFNAATDSGEKSDEDKAKEKAEAKKKDDEAVAKAENEKKLKNCGCGGKEGKHADNCTMYNSDGSDKAKIRTMQKKRWRNENKDLVN